MNLIRTKGRARQKAMTLAKKAGVEVKAVTFTKAEVEKALGHPLKGRLCTKRDTCWGRCFQVAKVIWLQLPVSVDTIAHEVMHLVTTTSHRTDSFMNRVTALSRGTAPGKAKVRDYLVTVTTVYRVSELTAHAAKEHYRRGDIVSTKHSARREG